MPEKILNEIDVDVSRLEASVDRACETIDTLRTQRDELLTVARAVEQLITRDSDDLGFHLNVVPMRIETVLALRSAIAKAEGRQS